jgi:hypothetical protein
MPFTTPRGRATPPASRAAPKAGFAGPDDAEASRAERLASLASYRARYVTTALKSGSGIVPRDSRAY